MSRTSFKTNLAGVVGVAAILLFIVTVIYVMTGKHDLSGNYYKDYNTYFYIDAVFFDDNGTFTMQTAGGYFYGKYYKKKGNYYLYPDSGTSNSSNPVSNVEENHMASEYYFIANPIADNTLEITMLGRGDYEYYLPWSGQMAIFYSIPPIEANAHEEELEKEPENDIGRPPEEDIVDW